MEKQNSGFIKKSMIILCIIGIFVIGYFMILLPIVNQGEGDPDFIFIEVPVNETINSSVIHLQDKDIMDRKGLEVWQENGKITGIIFRYSQTTPEISANDFNLKYGSRADDPSSRRYIEYKGVYYYAYLLIH
jgi:hypothetical protein